MDQLWTPWRYGYVTAAVHPDGFRECVFCAIPAAANDREHFVLHRARHCFVILNRYPYAGGHLLIAPYAHVATLEEANADALTEMFALTRTSEKHLRAVYRAPGFNLGMNIGACAGAGVAGHIHMHVLPRWPGDANFMTAVGETRVIPEDLAASYEKLLKAFRA